MLFLFVFLLVTTVFTSTRQEIYAARAVKALVTIFILENRVIMVVLPELEETVIQEIWVIFPAIKDRAKFHTGCLELF
jgi:hypothetical protein